MVIATLHLVLAWWLARHNREKATGGNVFILAGACLIITTSAAVLRKNIGYALPVWSASALLLAHLSAAWRNQGIRLTSYFMQAVTCAVAISSGILSRALFVTGGHCACRRRPLCLWPQPVPLEPPPSS